MNFAPRFETEHVYREDETGFIVGSSITFNRAHSVIDSWIDEGLFERRHIRVIERARDFWRDIRRPTHPRFEGDDPENRNDGLDAERAKAILHRCRRLAGDYRWSIFENICRWNELTGIPGSRFATIGSKSIEAAQNIVLDVADQIAWAGIL